MITRDMLTLSSMDFNVIGKIFEFLIADAEKTGDWIQIESMTVIACGASFNYDISLTVQPKENVCHP